MRKAEGASIKDIARRVGVSVSSVSGWVRDIELTPEQHAALQLRNVAYDRQMSGTWKQAGLPESCLCKSTVNVYSKYVYSKYSQKKWQNKLPYGTCRITVSRTSVAQNVFGAIQEIGGFTREAWLE